MKEIVVVLHNVRSLHNTGSIFRTADAAGIKKIYLTGIAPAPVDAFGRLRQQLTKVSLGAEKYVKWEKVGSASSPQTTIWLINKLRRDGYKIFCVEQSKKSIPYYKIKSYDSRHRKIVLVFGNEIKGLPVSILKRADKILEIPMKGKKESMNVAVTFGIVVFHLIHQ